MNIEHFVVPSEIIVFRGRSINNLNMINVGHKAHNLTNVRDIVSNDLSFVMYSHASRCIKPCHDEEIYKILRETNDIIVFSARPEDYNGNIYEFIRELHLPLSCLDRVGAVFVSDQSISISGVFSRAQEHIVHPAALVKRTNPDKHMMFYLLSAKKIVQMAKRMGILKGQKLPYIYEEKNMLLFTCFSSITLFVIDGHSITPKNPIDSSEYQIQTDSEYRAIVFKTMEKLVEINSHLFRSKSPVK